MVIPVKFAIPTYIALTLRDEGDREIFIGRVIKTRNEMNHEDFDAMCKEVERKALDLPFTL